MTGLLLVWAALAAACGPVDSRPGKEVPASWPVYPGCASYRTVSLRKWCFVHRLEARLQKDMASMSDRLEARPGDTLYLYLHLNERGRFVFDSLHPAPGDSIPLILDSLVRRLPAVEMPSGQPLPAYRMVIPLVIEE